MPDIITHYRFADAVFSRLPERLQQEMHRALYDHTAAGPDVWFSYRFWNGKQKRDKHLRGGQMHREKTGEFLLALTAQCRKSRSKAELFSYLAGYLCHYALDKTAHPYIVYRTGKYDGTPETLKYRGNHSLLERAIDLAYLKQWGKGLYSLPITGRILKLRRIPEEIGTDLEAVYRKVYGWENVYRDLNVCIRDQRRFYLLVQEPTGLLNRIIRHVDDGKSLQDYFSLPYAGRDQGELDVLNLQKRSWRHPCDGSIVSCESFPELFEGACRSAVDFILAADAFLSGNEEMPGDLFGSDSYETGFRWNDERNGSEREYEPLPLRSGRKYGTGKGAEPL